MEHAPRCVSGLGVVVGVFSHSSARIRDHESVITKPHHHHTHTQTPTMGLRSHEHENTTNTPPPLLVWA
ncbi:hypothetical protein BUV99_10995 [Corynebacterium diphtheriae]|nr:hypothetical protein BUV99_10995 [Corynebacterium diphtheriae]